MKIIVSGGAKNGKSTFAEKKAKELQRGRNIYYLATMIPHDTEDLDRINRHIKEREGLDFKTIECGYDISSLSLEYDASYLLDSITALLSNEMFKDGKVFLDAGKKVLDDLVKVANKVSDIVFVSDYIYSDANIYDEYSEKYRENLAYIDKGLAKICDKVYEVSFGNVKEFK